MLLDSFTSSHKNTKTKNRNSYNEICFDGKIERKSKKIESLFWTSEGNIRLVGEKTGRLPSPFDKLLLPMTNLLQKQLDCKFGRFCYFWLDFIANFVIFIN